MADTTQLPPDPEGLNDHRAKLAGCALAHYLELTEADPEDALSDLFCNLMHLCDRDGKLGGFDAQLERAGRNYQTDTKPDTDA